MSKSLLILTILLSTLSSSFAADMQCEIESIYQTFSNEKQQEAVKKLNDWFSSERLTIKQLRQAIFLTQANQKSVNDNHALNILFNLQKQLARAFYEAEQLKSATDAYEQAKQTLNTLQQMGNINKPSKQAREKVYYGLVDLLLTRAERTTDYDKRQAFLNEVIETLEVLKQAELQDYFEDDCLISGEERRLDDQLVDESNNDNNKRLGTLQTAILYPILFPDHLDLLKPRVVELLLIKFKPAVGEQKIKKEIIFKPAKNTNITTLNELNQQITRFREALQPEIEERIDYRKLVKEHGYKIYQLLFEPIELDLNQIFGQSQNNILVFVPDGSLRTIPLVALSDRHQRFVVQKNYAVATIPGLSLTKSVTEPLNRKNPKIFLGGMSEEVCYVFKEAPKMPTKCNNPDFPKLGKTKEALNSISAIYSGTTPQINEEFVIEKLEKEMRSIRPYTMMHLHTHATFKSGKNNTFLLTYNTQINPKDRLTMARLENIFRLGELRGYPIELLTLSACETAKGDEQSALGLAGVAFKSGARSVLATLWRAQELVTYRLVEEFYRQLKDNPKQSKVHALQKAQQKMITKKINWDTKKLEERTPTDRAPYLIARYWAPFILIGNWKI
ncbi:MAG TPA: CHAT domain-containing protein [Thiotrichaceae bacterium]|nr:CHAT domain-containing protein [Thiotrichaceae bacterium]